MNNPSAIIAPDLTKRPPRIPRSRLGGYALVPRMLEAVRVAVVRCRGEKNPVLKFPGEISHRLRDLGINRILRPARGRGMMRFIEDEQRAGTQIVEPRVHRADVGFINEQPVGDEETREGSPRVDAVSALAADAFHVVAVENLEGETEAILQLVTPLEKHRGRAGHDDFLHSAAQQQFGRDESRFDGFSEADIVCDEEVHARQPERLVERLQLIRIDADAGPERRLEKSGVSGGHAVPPDRVEECCEVSRLVESLVPDVLPSLLARNEPVEFRLPHDIEFLALCIVVRTGERNERAVICGIHRLHKPVTRANTNDISLGWNCDGHAQTTRGSIADAIPRSTLTLPLVWGSTMRRGFQKRDLNASEFSSQEVPCGALESSRASQVSS
jgi:hypothetical protein